MIQIVKILVQRLGFYLKVGGNICFFRYDFLFLGVSFVGNATPCLYFLTFSSLYCLNSLTSLTPLTPDMRKFSY